MCLNVFYITRNEISIGSDKKWEISPYTPIIKIAHFCKVTVQKWAIFIMGVFVFCQIKLKFCSWLYKKRWHTSCKFQLKETSNKTVIAKKPLTNLYEMNSNYNFTFSHQRYNNSNPYPADKMYDKCLVCFNLLGSSKSFKVGENIVCVSNSFDQGETPALLGVSSRSKLFAYIALWSYWKDKG